MLLSFKAILGTTGAIVSGVLFDATGSFASTWIVCLACSVVMLVFLLASEPIAAKLRASVAGEWVGQSASPLVRFVRGGASGRTSPHTLVRSDAPPRFVFVPYNDHYL